MLFSQHALHPAAPFVIIGVCGLIGEYSYQYNSDTYSNTRPESREYFLIAVLRNRINQDPDSAFQVNPDPGF